MPILPVFDAAPPTRGPRWIASVCLSLALFVGLVTPAITAEPGPRVPDAVAHEVAPGVFTLYGDLNPPTPENQGFMANSSFILTDAGVIVAELYGEGLTDFEMKPQVSERLAVYRDWSGFDDELGKHISLVYQEVEGEAF